MKIGCLNIKGGYHEKREHINDRCDTTIETLRQTRLNRHVLQLLNIRGAIFVVQERYCEGFKLITGHYWRSKQTKVVLASSHTSAVCTV